MHITEIVRLSAFQPPQMVVLHSERGTRKMARPRGGHLGEILGCHRGLYGTMSEGAIGSRLNQLSFVLVLDLLLLLRAQNDSCSCLRYHWYLITHKLISA